MPIITHDLQNDPFRELRNGSFRHGPLLSLQPPAARTEQFFELLWSVSRKMETA
jgi:hypothetical protein